MVALQTFQSETEFRFVEQKVKPLSQYAAILNMNKNSGKKIKFGPPPPGPLGANF